MSTPPRRRPGPTAPAPFIQQSKYTKRKLDRAVRDFILYRKLSGPPLFQRCVMEEAADRLVTREGLDETLVVAERVRLDTILRVCSSLMTPERRRQHDRECEDGCRWLKFNLLDYLRTSTLTGPPLRQATIMELAQFYQELREELALPPFTHRFWYEPLMGSNRR
jgi:hypothetical protein